MKRPLTLTGFILGTIFLGIEAIAGLILFIDFMNYTGNSIVIVALGLALALSIVSLIFNAISIPAWNKSPEVYRRKRGIIITAIVFNFIIVLFTIIGFASGETNPNMLTILEILGIIAANVLGIIDLTRESKKVGLYEEEDGVPVNEDDEEFVEVAPQYRKPQASSTSLEDKIIKLNQMKESGLIDEEEYKELKKKYISELL